MSTPTLDPIIALRAAHEGLPVAVIARVLDAPYNTVASLLGGQVLTGRLARMPKPDWPPGVPPHPPLPAPLDDTHVEFHCRHAFGLTLLEAGFLVVLLKGVLATKEQLHAVIEEQRNSRQGRPDRQEITDPKMVDVMICKLRKKLGPSFPVRTSWGKGYFLDPKTKLAISRRLHARARS